MSVSYTCPNPECGVTLKTPSRVQAGKSVKCPKCGNPFVPEPEEKGGGLKLAEEKPQAPPAAPKSRYEDEDEESDESVKKGYGVLTESEAEKEAAEKNKPTFTEVQEKFKKSARGPAMGLLVMPSNLLTLAGLLTCAVSLGVFLFGMWPLVFNDAPPGEEELEESVFRMTMGVCAFFWGAMVCFGASQMQELSSYPWAMIGAVMGIPMLVGIYCVVMLQDPKVKAGFAETSGGPDGEEEEDEDEDEDGKKGKKLARKSSRDEDDDEEDEEDDE